MASRFAPGALAPLGRTGRELKDAVVNEAKELISSLWIRLAGDHCLRWLRLGGNYLYYVRSFEDGDMPGRGGLRVGALRVTDRRATTRRVTLVAQLGNRSGKDCDAEAPHTSHTLHHSAPHRGRASHRHRSTRRRLSSNGTFHFSQDDVHPFGRYGLAGRVRSRHLAAFFPHSEPSFLFPRSCASRAGAVCEYRRAQGLRKLRFSAPAEVPLTRYFTLMSKPAGRSLDYWI